MAQMIILVVHDPIKVNPVVRKWIDMGVGGMTIMDSSGWAQEFGEHSLRDDLPLIPSVRKILREEEKRNRTLFSVIPEDFDLEALIAETEQILGPLDDPHTGIMFVLPVTKVYGLRITNNK